MIRSEFDRNHLFMESSLQNSRQKSAIFGSCRKLRIRFWLRQVQIWQVAARPRAGQTQIRNYFSFKLGNLSEIYSLLNSFTHTDPLESEIFWRIRRASRGVSVQIFFSFLSYRYNSLTIVIKSCCFILNS